MSGTESEEQPMASESPPVEEVASPPPLRRIIEAMLFVGGAPLTAVRAAEAVRGLTAEQFRDILDELNRDYRQQGRPYRIQVREQGCELVLQPHFRGVLDRLYGSTPRGPAIAGRPRRAGPRRLSAAAHETGSRGTGRRVGRLAASAGASGVDRRAAR